MDFGSITAADTGQYNPVPVGTALRQPSNVSSLETLSRGTEGQREQTLALLASLDLPKPSLGLPSQHQMPTQAWATMPLPSLEALPNPTCAAAHAAAKDGAAADSDQTTTALTMPLRTR